MSIALISTRYAHYKTIFSRHETSSLLALLKVISLWTNDSLLGNLTQIPFPVRIDSSDLGITQTFVGHLLVNDKYLYVLRRAT